MDTLTSPEQSPPGRGQQTRRAALAAAADLIAQRGWGRVSTRAVAERAGIRPGVVHYHFASQEQLLTEAAVSALADLGRGFAADLAAAPDVATGLETAVQALDEISQDDRTHLLLSETYLAASRDAAVAAAVRPVLAELRSILAGWLRETGLGEAEAAAAAALLVAALDGIGLHRSVDPSASFTGADRMLTAAVAAAGSTGAGR